MRDEEFFVDEEGSENASRQADSEVEIEAEESRADAKVKKLKDELAACKSESKENLDGWQRAKADYVNALKRFEAEKTDAKAAGVAKAAEALLPAFDALERAKEHGDIPKGFAGIIKQLESGFTSLGLAPVGEIGEAFDPAVHEALGQDPVDDAAKDDTVTAVLEKGWKVGNRVIRPAKVRVGTHDLSKAD